MKTSLAILIASPLFHGSAAAAQAAHPAEATAYTTFAESELLDFRYSFPSLVGSRPELLAMLRADRENSHAEILAMAREDAKARQSNHYPFHPYDFWRDWTLAGESPTLLSLRSTTQSFTGGAHGMSTTGLIVWDDDKKASLPFSGLFSFPSAYWSVLKGATCTALASERLRRAAIESTGCPKSDDLLFIPADTNSDWAFDTIQVVADPYVAGSYAEGRYEVPVAVTSALIAALKPEYRDSFEAQRLQ